MNYFVTIYSTSGTILTSGIIPAKGSTSLVGSTVLGHQIQSATMDCQAKTIDCVAKPVSWS